MRVQGPGVNWFVLAVILIAGFAVLIPVSGFVERSRPSLPPGYGDSDLAIEGSRLKGFAFGMEGAIADWYWMRSLQYIGDKLIDTGVETVNIDDLRQLNPRLLYPYLANATDLDPHFLAPYSYGAVVLPAIDPDKAIAITKKGIEHNPQQWRLYQHLGYIYWRLGLYDKASGAYDTGSRIPGAAPFMHLMAASMKSEGGSRDTARAIYIEMLQSSDDEQIRSTAKVHLSQIDTIEQREAIDNALSEYQRRTGHCPASLLEIFPSLASIKLTGTNEFKTDKSNRLSDPTGAPYLLDTLNCRLRVEPEHSTVSPK